MIRLDLHGIDMHHQKGKTHEKMITKQLDIPCSYVTPNLSWLAWSDIYWKSICKHLVNIMQLATIKRGLKMLSNRMIHLLWCWPVIPQVDLQDTLKTFRSLLWGRVGNVVESTQFDSNGIERFVSSMRWWTCYTQYMFFILKAWDH